MTRLQSAFLFSLLASTSPLAAQTALSDRPGMWISVNPRTPQADAPALVTPEASGAVILEAPSSAGVILEHRSITAVAPRAAAPSDTRPRPRPTRGAAVPEPDEDAGILAVWDGPNPVQRPREIADPLPEAVLAALAVPGASDPLPVEAAPEPVEVASPEPQPEPVVEEMVAASPTSPAVEDAAALAARLAAELAGDARAIMAAAQHAEVEQETVRPVQPSAGLAPIPQALHVVARMSARSDPAIVSAVILPGAAPAVHPRVQPAAFALPPRDAAPVLSRPLPEGPDLLASITAPRVAVPVTLAAVLMPQGAEAPAMPPRAARAPAPAPDHFPFSALPPEILPGGPESQTTPPVATPPVPEAMAAVLLAEPALAPAPLVRPGAPSLPASDAPPLDPDVPATLPEPDVNAVARMIADAEICWGFADLSPEAGWASLSVAVALDETNMPAADSIRLTGFGRVMSSDAEEAFHAARGALVGCAEASDAGAVTAPATLVFDRNGVRLR